MGIGVGRDMWDGGSGRGCEWGVERLGICEMEGMAESLSGEWMG
jgi:hypothetical protein